MNAASIQRSFETATPFVSVVAAEPAKITASPFRWPDHRTLPRRPWVWGRWLLRETVTAIVAPGGVGKSSFVASMILSLASGRQDILGKTVWAGHKTVWYWNLEDSLGELEMQLTAAAMFHRVGQAECGDRLYLDSGPEGTPLCIAVEDREGYSIAMPVVEALVAELLARKVDVLVIDPFVSSHSVSENDNVAIDAVAKTWARIAKRANCAVVLVHHSKKLAGEKVTAESSRGASALVSAARVTLVLNRMDKDEATKLGIAEERERRRLFTVQDDKANRAPAADAEWFRIASQDVANATGPDDPYGDQGDNVGVVTRWTPPDPFEGVGLDHLQRVQAAVAKREWRHSDQSPEWVGLAIADVFGFSVNMAGSKPRFVDPTEKARVSKMLSAWIANGVLRVEEGRDERRKPVKFVVPGEPAQHGAPPPSGGAEQGGAGRAAKVLHHHPAPVGGGVEHVAQNRVAQVEQKGRAKAVDYVAGNPALGPVRRPPVDFSRYERPSAGKQILAPGESEDDPIPGGPWEGFGA
jgi:hypothetical protein